MEIGNETDPVWKNEWPTEEEVGVSFSLLFVLAFVMSIMC